MLQNYFIAFYLSSCCLRQYLLTIHSYLSKHQMPKLDYSHSGKVYWNSPCICPTARYDEFARQGATVIKIERIERKRESRRTNERKKQRRKERMHSLKPPCKYLLMERVDRAKIAPVSLFLPLVISSSFSYLSSSLFRSFFYLCSSPICWQFPSYRPLFSVLVFLPRLSSYRVPAGIANCKLTWKICLREKRARRSSRPSLFSNFSATDK